ncbi:MAG: HAMP domain-containing histidine kinase [Desulfobulbaceae bacterium]|nr:MAG: HAMP domain-containing histidine kinase [Desulfobulbaceae bacterium]
MFLKSPLKSVKSIKFKITVLYSGLFLFSSLLLFAAIYVSIASTLTRHDREMLLTELRELASEYSNSGLPATEKLLEVKRKFHRQHPFLVRIADVGNRTVDIYMPSPWTEFNVEKLEEMPPEEQPLWLNLPAIGGDHYLDVASMRLNNRYWLQVGMSSEERDNILLRLRATFWVVFGPMVILGFICGWILAYNVLRPVRNLLFAVKSVQTGIMDAHVPVRGVGDELDELAIHFNKMLQKISAVLQAMKDCVDNVAHDLRTPVTRLRNLAENALQEPYNTFSQHAALVSCAEESERINVMLNILLDISEAESGVMQLDRQNIKIYGLVQNIVDAYSLLAEDKSIQIRIDGDCMLEAKIDPNRMSQALANLIDNAVKYTPAGGMIDIVFLIDEENVIIRIHDSGIGIDPEELPQIWDRLYRGKQNRSQRGLGLGLSQVKAIVEAHRGNIKVASERGQGSVFTISLPAMI